MKRVSNVASDKKIPILFDHKLDLGSPIGSVSTVGGVLEVTLESGHELTVAQVFDTFGNCGFEVLQQIVPEGGGEPRLKVFRIREFSLAPPDPKPKSPIPGAEIEPLETLIPSVAEVRDAALASGEFGGAILLSHVLAWLNFFKAGRR
jgi:hypothetical protein